jgi:hypothetical protein
VLCRVIEQLTQGNASHSNSPVFAAPLALH